MVSFTSVPPFIFDRPEERIRAWFSERDDDDDQRKEKEKEEKSSAGVLERIVLSIL